MHHGDSHGNGDHHFYISDLTREKAELVKNFIAGIKYSLRKVPKEPGARKKEEGKLGPSCGQDAGKQPQRARTRENSERCTSSGSKTQQRNVDNPQPAAKSILLATSSRLPLLVEEHSERSDYAVGKSQER